LIFTRFRLLALNQRDEEALALIPRLPSQNAAPFALHLIQEVTYRNKQWDSFISSALQMMNFALSPAYKSQLHAELATAYFELGDDNQAVSHAEEALNQPADLGGKNSQVLLHILGQALVRMGLADRACEKYQQYNHIKRSFILLLEEADTYLKSTIIDKHEKALALVIRAFEEVDSYDDELYLSPLVMLVELDNLGVIPTQDEPTVEDGLFVKLDGFQNGGWFYIGEGTKSLGAEHIKQGTDRYDALIHKAVSDDVDWPPDKFSRPKIKRTILHVVTPPAFLSHRAHEVMINVAQIGGAPVWSVNIAEEDGSFSIDRLKQFLREVAQPDNEFFDLYVTTPIPFSFLCSVLSGLPRALSRIVS